MVYNYFIPILIITCSLLIPNIAFPINDTELAHICLPNNKPFTSNYTDSRQSVVEKLITNTPSRGGFWVALDEMPRDLNDRAYGLALCRDDVSPDDCLICVSKTALAVIDTDHCPDSRSAIIWRDYCFLKYSDVDFFGKIDTDNEFSSVGGNMWTLQASIVAVKTLVDSLCQTAIQSPRLDAYGTSDIRDGLLPDDNVRVYGMTQCTRDISPRDCKDCLNNKVKWLPTIRQGGKILCGSCNIRYEIYNFNSSAIN